MNQREIRRQLEELGFIYDTAIDGSIWYVYHDDNGNEIPLCIPDDSDFDDDLSAALLQEAQIIVGI